jgi:hypothetical protein
LIDVALWLAAVVARDAELDFVLTHAYFANVDAGNSTKAGSGSSTRVVTRCDLWL